MTKGIEIGIDPQRLFLNHNLVRGWRMAKSKKKEILPYINELEYLGLENAYFEFDRVGCLILSI